MLKRRSITTFLLIIMLCVLILNLPCKAVSNDNREISILVLSSYGQNNIWEKKILNAIENSLNASKLNVKTDIEYIDAKDSSDTKYYNALSGFYKEKYARSKFDAIIVCDDFALDFIIKCHDEIFPSTPVVFCGVNKFDDDRIKGKEFITGVTQSYDIKGTINLALKLQNNIHEIVIVGDDTGAVKKLDEAIKDITNVYRDRIKIIRDKGSNMDELQTNIKGLKKDSMVLLVGGCRRISGEYIDISKCANILSGVSNIPIYSSSGNCLGEGIVGGMMTTGRYQGNKAAELTLRILNGERASDIRVGNIQPDTYILDDVELKKHNLSANAVPKNSKIINSPSRFYSVSKRTLWAASLTIICILIFLIILLIKHIAYRRKAEKALRESEEILRTLINAAPDVICFKDGEGKWMEANDFCLQVFKLTGVDYKGKTNKELGEYSPCLKDRCSTFHKIDDSAWVKKTSMRYEVDGFYQDGEKKTYDTIVVPLFYSDGARKGLVILGRDITENKKIEESKRLLDEAMQFDKLKTEFFANISHELRTPLNVMLSTLQLLDLYINNGSIIDNGAKLDRNMYILRQNSLRLLRLVNNLIDITRIDSGYLELQLQNSDIVSIVEDITLSVKEYVESKSIDLVFDTDVEEKILACDSDKIERIMLNLLSNAVKFTEAGGRISVNLYDETEYIKIVVSDTGIGIPLEKQDIIFERFRQVDKSLARANEGSGIGLSLVKSLVMMHGGDINVESEYHKGSRFIIKLPVKVLSKEETKIDNSIKAHDNLTKINLEFSDIY